MNCDGDCVAGKGVFILIIHRCGFVFCFSLSVRHHDDLVLKVAWWFLLNFLDTALFIMAAECIKDCCRFFRSKEDEPEPEGGCANLTIRIEFVAFLSQLIL